MTIRLIRTMWSELFGIINFWMVQKLVFPIWHAVFIMQHVHTHSFANPPESLNKRLLDRNRTVWVTSIVIEWHHQLPLYFDGYVSHAQVKLHAQHNAPIGKYQHIIYTILIVSGNSKIKQKIGGKQLCFAMSYHIIILGHCSFWLVISIFQICNL